MALRSFAAGALASICVACSPPLGHAVLPLGAAPATSIAARSEHLYAIVTTSTRYVAEYPIDGGIPGAKPDRIVTGFFAPNALTVDNQGRLYVLDRRTIKEFAAGADGHARPIREIYAPSFLNIDTLAVDARGYLYVGQSKRLYVYAPGAHGHAKPVTVVKPVGYPAGLTLDASDDLYALGNTQEMDPYLAFQTHVTVYGAAPGLQRVREFCTPEFTRHGIDYGVALDGKGRLFTTHTYFVNSYPVGEVDVFPADANACPEKKLATITMTPSLLEPVYLAVNSPYLYVADVDYGNGGVVFTLRTTGSPQKPLAVLQIANDQPHNVFGIALGP
ncbi:MAG TPA: hypothetical protein VGI19_00880 [Candidatus Cybelea sp.]|jgi:hypothetical protein